MDLPEATVKVSDNPFMDLPTAANAPSWRKYLAIGEGPPPGQERLPSWVQKLRQYTDPMQTLGGLPGVVSMALPAGKGPIKAPTAEELHNVGNADIAVARQSPVALDGSKVAQWAQGVQAGLRRRGMQPTSSSAPNTHSILDDLKTTGNPFFSDGRNLSVADYIDLRRALQAEAQKFSPGAKYDQAAASLAIQRLDNLFDTTAHSNFVRATPSEIARVRSVVKDARANQAAGFRSDTLTNKQTAAELQTRATNSGMNLDNKIRQKLVGLVNPDNARGTTLAQRSGYSPAEEAEMNRIVGGVRGANAARTAGNLMGGGGGLGAVVSGAVGAGGAAAAGHPWAALAAPAIPAAGMGLKMVENALTNRALTNLASSVRMRSPLGVAAQPGPYSPNALAAKLLLAAPDAWYQMTGQE